MASSSDDAPKMEDPTAWVLDNSISDFLLMTTPAIRYMCLFGYTMLHGTRVFSAMPASNATSFKIVSFVLACTGGGIMVPIFLNGIPVPLANDALPIAVITSFAIHQYFPIVREVYKQSDVLKVCFVVMFETFRAGVVAGLTTLAASRIAPSLFSFPLFGPIFCGGIGGCGGAFLPMNKGLDPIKRGLASPMLSALVGAAAMHLFLNSSLSEGCVDAKAKAHVHLAVFFITIGLINALGLNAPDAKPKVTAAKKN